eukprot:scaffold170576_cov30-Tisochrysis_lutea.AAC.1
MCKEKRHGESVKKKRAALDSKDSWDSSDTEPEKLKKKTPRQQQLSMFFGAHEPSVPGKESTDAGAPSAEDRTTETAATVVTSDDDSDASNDFDFDLPQQASDGTQMAGKASEGKANVQSNVHSTESQLLPGWTLERKVVSHSGREYLKYIGPNGVTAQSVNDMYKKAGLHVRSTGETHSLSDRRARENPDSKRHGGEKAASTAADSAAESDDSDASQGFEFDLPQRAADRARHAPKASGGGHLAKDQGNLTAIERKLVPGWVSPTPPPRP